jgi:hypothetical protein
MPFEIQATQRWLLMPDQGHPTLPSNTPAVRLWVVRKQALQSLPVELDPTLEEHLRALGYLD